MCSGNRLFCTVPALVFVVILWAVGTATAGRVVFSGDLRLRYELQDGFNQKYYGENPPYGKKRDGFVLGRSRIGADWFFGSRIHLALWVQDSSAWDWSMPRRAFYNKSLDANNNPEQDHSELYTTYLELSHLFGLPLSLKVGRQCIAYGDHRVFGPGQWGNSGHYLWDAVKVRIKRGPAFLDLFYGRNIIHEVNRFSLNHRHDKSSLAAYGHLPVTLKGGVHTTIEPFIFTKWDRHNRFRGERGGEGRLLLTYGGAHWSGGWRFLDWNHTWVGMWGHKGPDPVSAYAYHLEAGINPSFPVRARFYLAYSYASGDKNPHDGAFTRFDGAFGSVDKAYGRMNLFKWSNLEDTEGGIELWPGTMVHVKAEYHHFRLAQSRDGWSHNPSFYRSFSGGWGKEMGHEFDLVAKWGVSKGQEIQVGYGHFWPGGFVKHASSSSQASWVFAQYEFRLGVGVFHKGRSLVTVVTHSTPAL